MVGAHLDSWTGGTGATDNAAGAATVIEAMRILKRLNLQMDRTVRVALWSAEEAAALGSREYVRTHLGDAKAAEYKDFCCYFNIDGGSGKIRGIFAANNDVPVPYSRLGLLLSKTSARLLCPRAMAEGPITAPSTRLDCRASICCKIRWTTAAPHITRTWTAMIGFDQVI